MKELMIVDDSIGMAELYKIVAKKTGKIDKVTCIEHSVDAVGMLNDNYRPDAILSDINMPKVNGFDIYDLAKTYDIPTFLYTNHIEISEYKEEHPEIKIFKKTGHLDEIKDTINEIVESVI